MVEKKKRNPISEDKKKYVCDVCGKKCANPSALNMHKKWKHSGDSGGGEESSFRKEERGSEEEEKSEWVPF